MEIKIDGQTIVLSPAQAEQFKKAVLKETSVPASKQCGNLTLHCKKPKGTYPFIISTSALVPPTWGIGERKYGKDFSLCELKTFIKNVKAYAALIWTTAEKELKNV